IRTLSDSSSLLPSSCASFLLAPLLLEKAYPFRLRTRWFRRWRRDGRRRGFVACRIRKPEHAADDERRVRSGRQREGEVHFQPPPVELVAARLVHAQLAGHHEERPLLVLEKELRRLRHAQIRKLQPLRLERTERRGLDPRIIERRIRRQQRKRPRPELVAQFPRQRAGKKQRSRLVPQADQLRARDARPQAALGALA